MNRFRTATTVALAVLMLCGRSAAGESPAKTTSEPAKSNESRLVVYTLRAPPELERLAHSLTDEILVHLGKRTDVRATGEAELKLMLSQVENAIDLSSEDCRRASECLVKITQLAEADRLLSGRLGKVADEYFVTLSLINAKMATVEKRETASVDTEGALIPAVIKAIDALLGEGEKIESRFKLGTNKKKVVILPLQGLAERRDVLESLTQLFGLELKRYDDIDIVTSDEIEALIDQALQRERCKTELMACLLEIGRTADANYMATGAVGRFDDSTFVLVLKLIDLDGAVVANRVSESMRSPDAQLPKAMRFAVANLLGRQIEGQGDLAIVTEVEGELTLDNKDSKKLPLTESIRGLKSGKHALSIVDLEDDYYPWFGEVYVEPQAEARFTPDLVERPIPWYSSVWFWSVVGAVAIGAGVTTYVLLDPPDEAEVVGGIGVRAR